MKDVDDRRKSWRNRALKDGKVVFNGGRSLINCTVRDRTESGAKLQFVRSTELPKVFELHCLSEVMSYPAAIVWRRGDQVGITFTGLPNRLPRRVMTKGAGGNLRLKVAVPPTPPRRTSEPRP